jgi:lipoyl(octanoyl) transferase
MVNDRQNLDLTHVSRPAGGGAVEWLISDAPVPYPEAVAAMRTSANFLVAREEFPSP